MELLFEKSRAGRGCDLLPPLDVPPAHLMEGTERRTPLRLPEMSEVDLSRHYSELERRSHGVNNGFYPLGSCTMKYNPRIHEETAALPGFAGYTPPRAPTRSRAAWRRCTWPRSCCARSREWTA